MLKTITLVFLVFKCSPTFLHSDSTLRINSLSLLTVLDNKDISSATSKFVRKVGTIFEFST